MSRNPEIAAKAKHHERVRLLWDVCQIPDFRKVMAEAHTRLLDGIYAHLTGPGERLPNDWLTQQVKRQDRTDGDIDTLMGRIAATRTWTYISHRGDWVDDPLHWQGVTRAIEDRLSDALHERLTQRFVDRRTAVLVKKMRESSTLAGRINDEGQVQVEGHAVGQLAGFRFRSEQSSGAFAARAVLSAAERALKPEIAQRIQSLEQDEDAAFTLTADGDILWRDDPIARLLPGPNALTPLVESLSSDLLDPTQREKIRKRAQSWVKGFIGRAFGPVADPDGVVPPGPMRGLLHALAQGLGGAPRKQCADQVKALSDKERGRLAQWGIRIATRDVFVSWLQKPAMLALRAVLYETYRGARMPILDDKTSLIAPADLTEADAACLGFSCLAGYWVRMDVLDRFVGKVTVLAKTNPTGFAVPPGLAQSIKLPVADAEKLVTGLGYRKAEAGFSAAPRKPKQGHKHQKVQINSDSPFAVLKKLSSA
jgi:ATP-dependent RNA helicase SUPV3L1/SUV3